MEPEHEHTAAAEGAERDEDDIQFNDEDVVEIVEDDGPGGEPMDDDDDPFGGYDGEIVIGGPGPGEEDMEGMEEVDEIEDNSWGASCELERCGQARKWCASSDCDPAGCSAAEFKRG